MLRQAGSQHATVVDEAEAASSGVVTVGSKVELERDDGERLHVEITSVGGVSPDSPVGRALLGKAPGDEIEVDAPRGRWRARASHVRQGAHGGLGLRERCPSRHELEDELPEYAAATAGCTRCRLAQGRTQVVFGSGSPHADLMFVGEAPGFHEDKQGVPFVGQAGKLLDSFSRASTSAARTCTSPD